MSKQPTGVVGNQALYYVCYRLSLRGWNVMPTTKNTAGIDIVCINRDGTQRRTIQVKGLSKRPAVPLGRSLDKIMGDFWVVVNQLSTGQPQLYILSADEVRERAVPDSKGQYWLPAKTYERNEFNDKWDRIGVPI